MVPGPIPFMDGFGSSGHHAQMLRNQRVGSTWITASSGPRLHTLIYINKIDRCRLCIFHEYVEIPVFIEYAGVDQFVSGSLRIRLLLVFIKSR